MAGCPGGPICLLQSSQSARAADAGDVGKSYIGGSSSSSPPPGESAPSSSLSGALPKGCGGLRASEMPIPSAICTPFCSSFMYTSQRVDWVGHTGAGARTRFAARRASMPALRRFSRIQAV